MYLPFGANGLLGVFDAASSILHGGLKIILIREPLKNAWLLSGFENSVGF